MRRDRGRLAAGFRWKLIVPEMATSGSPVPCPRSILRRLGYRKTTSAIAERANGALGDRLRAFVDGRTDDRDAHAAPYSPSVALFKHTRRSRWTGSSPVALARAGQTSPIRACPLGPEWAHVAEGLPIS